jgi:hypothetical protein
MTRRAHLVHAVTGTHSAKVEEPRGAVQPDDAGLLSPRASGR